MLILALAAACTSPPQTVHTSSGLVYTVTQPGTGPTAQPGQHVLIHETTRLPNGQIHFSTRSNDRPLRFLLGGNQVIAGVDEGVTGMRVGERRQLIVPAALSRRSSYPKALSPDDTLHYDIELVAIEAP
jgi:FKBP-type peptidyl-prolyl cis-trans isomerase